MHSFAWPHDPIAHAFIEQSGSAGIIKIDSKRGASSWFKLSSILGCGGVEAGDATLKCMREKDYTEIMNASKKIQPSGDMNSFNIGPIIDDKTVFADYEALGAAGMFAKKVSHKSLSISRPPRINLLKARPCRKYRQRSKFI